MALYVNKIIEVLGCSKNLLWILVTEVIHWQVDGSLDSSVHVELIEIIPVATSFSLILRRLEIQNCCNTFFFEFSYIKLR